MIPFLISATVLTTAVILLRQLFKNRISRRLQYTLWLIVVIRLVLPVQLGTSPVSIDRTAPVKQAETVVTGTLREPVSGPSYTVIYSQVVEEYVSAGQNIQRPEIQTQVHAETTQRIKTPTFGEIANTVWLVGAVLMGAWFLFVNLRFRHTLHKFSAEITVAECPIPVKVCGKLQSPCLSGIFRPTVYLTENCADDPQRLRHILAHELTHLRHGDLWWSAVRSILLCVYWFHPLVWVAAILSKRDCELACDEGALKRLGEDQRIAYGKTLLDTVARTPSPHHLLETATSMNETKKQLKERVNFIVRKPKFYLILTVCVLLIAAVATACTFTGATKPTVTPTDPTETLTNPTEATQVTTTPPTTIPATTPPEPPVFDDYWLEQIDLVFTGYRDMRTNWYNAAMLATFDSVEELDAYDLFSVGTGNPEDSRLTDEELDYLRSTTYIDQGYSACRMSREYVENVLDQYFGLTTADLKTESDKFFIYWEKTDCYYVISEGHAALDFRLLGAVRQPDGTILFEYYHPYVISPKNIYETVIRPVGGGYHVLSNRIIEKSNLNPYAKLEVETPPDTEDVVAQLENLFSYRDDVSSHRSYWYNAALRMRFSSIEEIEVCSIFCMTPGIPGCYDLTSEEIEFLQNYPHYASHLSMEIPVYRIERSYAEDVLSLYFGIQPGEIEIESDAMVYWKKTDCYYVAGDPGCISKFKVVRAERADYQGESYLRILYNDAQVLRPQNIYELHLRIIPGGYQILSNVVIPTTENHLDEQWWATSQTEPLSYKAYFSETRNFTDTFLTYGNRWLITEDGIPGTPYYNDIPEHGYALCLDEDGFLVVYFENDDVIPAKLTGDLSGNMLYYSIDAPPLEVVWRLPDDPDLENINCYLSAGRYAYYVLNQQQIVRLDLTTNKKVVLFEADHIPTEHPDCIGLYDQEVLIFLTQTKSGISVNRLYLPTMTHDVLYRKIPLDAFRCEFAMTMLNSDLLCWRIMNPDFFPRLLEIVNDPESSFYNHNTDKTEKYHDIFDGYKNIMNCTTIEELAAHRDFIVLVQTIEMHEETPSLLNCTYNIRTGEYSETPYYWDPHMNE